MPLFPEHAPRRRLLDVSELLGEQVVRLDKAQGNVTPDEYRRYQEERAAQSKAFAEQQSKLHPTKPPVEPPKQFGQVVGGFHIPKLEDLKDPEFWNAAAKVPGKLAEGVTAGVGNSGIISDQNAWRAKRIAEALSPVDISEGATPGSQAVGAIASLTGARLLTVLNNLRKLKGTAKASHEVTRDLVKSKAVAKAEADRLKAESQRILGQDKPYFSDASRVKPTPKVADDLLGLPSESAGRFIGGAAEGAVGAAASQATRKSFLDGVKRAVADGFRQKMGVWPKGLTGIGGLGALGYLAWQNSGSMLDKAGGALGLDSAIRNRPPDLPFAVPDEAPGPASPPAKVKPADVKEEIRAADREWIDPRHGGARGVNEQGFADKILQRPSNRDLAGIRGSAAEESVRSNAGFAEARSAYMRLKNKVRILNERGIPLGSGLTPFELEDWNTFNSPDLRTSSGLSIYDPEAARNAK